MRDIEQMQYNKATFERMNIIVIVEFKSVLDFVCDSQQFYNLQFNIRNISTNYAII